MQDDLELGRVVLQVVAASAALGGSGGAVNGSTDSAEVILDGLSAALDLSFAATPTTFYASGQCGSVTRVDTSTRLHIAACGSTPSTA